MKKLIDIPDGTEMVLIPNGAGRLTKINVTDLVEGKERTYVVVNESECLYVYKHNDVFSITDDSDDCSILSNRDAHYVINKLAEFGFELKDPDTYEF